MSISTKLVRFAAVTAIMMALGAGSVFAQATGRLKIGTEGAYPPFNTLTADGKLVGFDIDIANALCAQMKVECELVTQDWDGIIPALQASKFDAIIASMTITEERKKQVDFTNKYYTTPLSVVALKDSELTLDRTGSARRQDGRRPGRDHAEQLCRRISMPRRARR